MSYIKKKRQIDALKSNKENGRSNSMEPPRKRPKTTGDSSDSQQSSMKDWKCSTHNINFCRRCYDRKHGLRPELDASGNVKGVDTIVFCPENEWGKEQVRYSQWQSVAKKHPELNNESTTEEWQAALKAMFGKRNTRLYLNCPFSDKDACKRLGGKWDPVKKNWFVPKGMDCGHFTRWM